MTKSSDLFGGNKKVYIGPKGGKYVMVVCDGKKKKKYLKKNTKQTI